MDAPSTPQPRVAERHCASPQALAHELASTIAGELREAIAQRGRALLAVSGGKSPIALFQALRVHALDWAKVNVLLVDERCVPHTPTPHPDSNTALVRQHLLQDLAAAATFWPFFDTLPHASASTLTANEPLALDAVDALPAAANQRLAALSWPLEVLVLGMGEDGHTASLFPGVPGLARALVSAEVVAAVRPDATDQAPHARLSLTLPTLLAARHTHLSIVGTTKQAVYRQALARPDAALPVSLVLHGQPPHNQPHALTVWLA
ncbi:MAG: 6-phosphogluconolactonase [Burkholderiaceae bacterium]|nr:6-phosphogluconolactonase [Burkholderiaceae bacterium]